MGAEGASGVVLRIKGEHLPEAPSTAPGTWWEPAELSCLILWLFFLLTSAHPESRLAAAGIHLIRLGKTWLPGRSGLGRTRQDRHLLPDSEAGSSYYDPFLSAAAFLLVPGLFSQSPAMGLAGSIHSLKSQVMGSGAGGAPRASASAPFSSCAGLPLSGR